MSHLRVRLKWRKLANVCQSKGRVNVFQRTADENARFFSRIP